ncbi:MAG: NAD(P)-binding domain-containing protein [Novosphingobium sp.]|nr:NAD(P)-binding domain-containing protein [Novosphingobium sp.]
MSAASAHSPVVLVGCGNMGRAILDGWLAAGAMAPEAIRVVDPFASELPQGVRRSDGLAGALEGIAPSAIVLAVKPQQVEEVAESFAGSGQSGEVLLLSILAGVETVRLATLFPGTRVVRFMSNLAAAFGAAPVGAFPGGELPRRAQALAEALLAPLGDLTWLANEDQFHAFTALAGSGPGFVYRFLAALQAGGEALGFAPEEAARLALTTVRGAVELAGRSPDDFAGLAARVASKGGTTAAGYAVLDADHALDRLIAATLRAAAERSAEMARA